MKLDRKEILQIKYAKKVLRKLKLQYIWTTTLRISYNEQRE
jgi:hypothetical protein